MNNCPPVITYPTTLTYHPLEGNVVSRIPIYDYSHHPPLLIGYREQFYSTDGCDFSLKNFLVPSDPITWASTAQTAGDVLVTAGKKNLGELAKFIVPVCPECVSILTTVALIDSANSAITFDGHLVTSVVYFQQPPISLSPSGAPIIQVIP